MDKISSSFSELVFAGSDERDVVALQMANATLTAQLAAIKEACQSLERKKAAEVQRVRQEAEAEIAMAQKGAIEAVEAAEKRAKDAETRLAEADKKVKDLMQALEDAYRRNVAMATDRIGATNITAAVGDDVARDWVADHSRQDWHEWKPLGGNELIVCPSAGFVACCGDAQAGTSLPPPRQLRAVAPEVDVDWLKLLLGRTAMAGLELRVATVRSGYAVVVSERFVSEKRKALCAVLHSEAPLERFEALSAQELDAYLKQKFGGSQFKLVSSGFWSKSLFERLENVVHQERSPQYKIGIIRWIAGQSENEALANPMSPEYEAFLGWIGRKVSVADTAYKGGLSELTGPFSYAATLGGAFDVMFHVPPMLPRGIASDTQCLERKRFTGNDVVNIVFLEGAGPFSPESISSQFNHAWVVVRKVLPNSYQVGLLCKEGFPRPTPLLPLPCVFEATPHFRDFILWLAVNLERSALQFASVFVTKTRRTRATLLAAACETCFPGWVEPELKPRKSAAPIRALDLNEGKQKLKKVSEKTLCRPGEIVH